MMLSGFIGLSPKVADLLLFGTLVHSSQPLRAVQWLTGESARRLAPWPCGELLRHNGRYKDNTYIRRFCTRRSSSTTKTLGHDSRFGKFFLKFLVPKTSTGRRRGISRRQRRRV